MIFVTGVTSYTCAEPYIGGDSWRRNRDRETPMAAALKYLSRITDTFFETRMQRAARKISVGMQLFPR